MEFQIGHRYRRNLPLISDNQKVEKSNRHDNNTTTDEWTS